MTISIILNAIARVRLLSPDDEESLWRRIAPEDRARLIISYQPLVVSALRRISPSDAYIEDCLSEGLLALIRAVDRFKPGAGVAFSVYARLRIKGAMLDYLRRASRGAANADEFDARYFIALADPRGLSEIEQDKLHKVLSAVAELGQRERAVIEMLYIEDMTRDEVAASLGVSPSRISQIHATAIKRLRGKVFAKRKRRFSLFADTAQR